MGDPAKKLATYEDVLNAPEHKVAEVLAGELHLSPRPAGPDGSVTSILGGELGQPFSRGRGGPGGWIILDEPEIHLGRDIVVPDLAGWRRERMPLVADEPFFSLSPDWICEVLSPSTEKIDRVQKLAIYAREKVQHAWLIDPRKRTLEALRLHEGKWLILATHHDDDKARIEPFDAIELDLSILWADLAPTP